MTPRKHQRLLAGVSGTPGWVWVGTSMVEPDDGI